jgi:hypothetical protein
MDIDTYNKKQKENIKLIVESLFHSADFQIYRNQIKNIIYTNAKQISTGIDQINENIQNDEAPYKKYYEEDGQVTGKKILHTLQDEFDFYKPPIKKLIKPSIMDCNTPRTPHILQTTTGPFTKHLKHNRMLTMTDTISQMKPSAPQTPHSRVI